MPIYIQETPEPLSDLSYSIEDGAPQPILIGSDAARQLTNELRLYCSGDTTGRSFLIAGHRGAGKSTLVANAFLEIWKECERGTGGLRRPLFVPLNGPSLFTTPAGEPAPAPGDKKKKGNGGGETDAANVDAEATNDDGEDEEEEEGDDTPPTAGEPNEAQLVLEQIILGLHRAVAQEFSYRYRKRAQEMVQAAEGNQRPGATQLPRQPVPLALAKPGLAELCAQFDTDLMECPEPARLREYYSHVRRNGGSGQLEGILGREWALNPQFQAAAELLALTGTCEAYKRISGKYTRSEKIKDEFFREMEKNFGRESTIKDTLAPLMPLLVGGVAGVGAGAAGSGGLAAAGAGVIAALGSAAVVKYTRRRTTTRARAENFIFDLSLATLDRAIPVLVDRLWNAGLAPMFVIDELDKVDNLGERMQNIVHHLKKLVAENAFFCFLADREYFEGMLRQGSNDAYPKVYTYYSRRLFAVLESDDFATYLDALLVDQPPARTRHTGGKNVVGRRPGQAGMGGLAAGSQPRPGESPAEGQSAATATAAPTAASSSSGQQHPSTPMQSAASMQAGQVLADTATAPEATMRQLLIWILRHRSQLHPLDLRRQLTALRSEGGFIKLSPGDVQHPMYLIDVTMQVFIEALLNDGEVMNKVAGNHEELRLIHDALYYITRQWLDGAQRLEISTQGKKNFETYLEQRTGLKKKEKKTNGEAHETQTANEKKEHALHEHDRVFLFGLVARLAEALANTDVLSPQSGDGFSPARQLIASWEELVRARSQQAGHSVAPSPVPTEVKNAILQGKRSVLEIRETSDPTPDVPFGTVIYQWRYEPSGMPRQNPPADGPSAGDEARPSPPPPPPPGSGAAPVGPPPAPAPARAAASEQGPAQPAAATVSTPTPTTGAPSAAPTTESQAAGVSAALVAFQEIEAFLQMLNRAIGVPNGESPYIRYEMLADQLRILPTSPSWETVRAAGARLASSNFGRNLAAAQRSMDEGIIQDFAGMLARTRQCVVNAIACAAVIGAATEDGDTRHRVVLGLQILSQGLQLHRKEDPTTAIENVVKELRQEFKTTFSDAVAAGGGGMQFPRVDRVLLAITDAVGESTVVDMLETELTAFARSAQIQAELRNNARWQRLLNKAWARARERAVPCLLGSPSRDAHVSEMICFARNQGPGAALTFRFPDLSATTFTNLLYRSLQSPQTSPEIGANEIPAWVGLAALHALGFGTFDPTALEGVIDGLLGKYTEPRPVLHELATAGLVMGRRPPDTSVIAITRAETLFASWPVRTDCLFLAGRPVEISKIVELPLQDLIVRESIVLAIEMDRGSETLPRDIDIDRKTQELPIIEKVTARLGLTQWAMTYIYTHQPTSKRAPSPALVSPKSLEEVLGSAFRNVPLA